MSRFLVAVPPFAGHVNPVASVARELELRGHEVAWVGLAADLRARLGEAARIHDVGVDPGAATQWRPSALGESIRQFFEEVVVPLAGAMLPAVETACSRFEPDVVIADQAAPGALFAARRLGLRAATSATSGELFGAQRVPALRSWLDGLLAPLQRRAGLEPLAFAELSTDLVVAYTCEEFAGPLDVPRPVELVGAALAHREEADEFPWGELAELPTVLVTLGTSPVRGTGRFLRATLDGLAGEPVQAVFVAPAGTPGPPTGHVVVRPHVPQLALLSRVDAVVCHGGLNTVTEALAHGVPLVVAPAAFDQPFVASRVVECGAGLRVRFGRAGPAELREAVLAVLHEPAFRLAAQRLRGSLEQAGGASRAAAVLEALAAQPRNGANRSR